MFTLRKLVAPLLLPLSVCLEILVVGLILLWFTRRQKAGKFLVTAGALILTALSYGPPVSFLLAPLENRYPAASAQALATSATPPRWIVILGGGYTPDERLPVTSRISPASLARLVEGVRLYKQWPGTKVVVSGGKGFDSGPEAEPIARVAQILGVARSDLVIEDESLDTEDQVRRVEPIVGRSGFFLVTSASHIPRAVALFHRRGLHPIAAPADYELKGRGGFAPNQLYPQAENIRRAEKAIYEYLGLAWASLRGAI